MPRVLEGQLVSLTGRFAIVAARWNALVTDRLIEGAVGTLARHGVDGDRVTIVRVPGSFEIPQVASRLAHTGHYVAVLCLGAVVKGETTHDEYINSQVAAGIARAAESSGVPVTFGVLTCLTMEQALDRAGGKSGNKGEEAALAALEMANLLDRLDDLDSRDDPKG
jgi:6,7-dimethyl-8-ribityllumazine synthase